MKYIHSYWDRRVVNTLSSTVVTPVNDHAAVAAGHYGDLRGDALRLPVVFIATVPTILPSLTPPTLLFLTCGTMQLSPGGLTRTSRCPHRFFLAATAFFCLVTVRHFAGLSAAVPPLRRHVGRSLSLPPSCAPSQPCRRLHDCPSHAAVASQSSPPASLLTRWALVIIFSRHSTLSRQRAVGVPGITGFLCSRPCGPTF